MSSRVCPIPHAVIQSLRLSIAAASILILTTPFANAQWRIAPSIGAGLEYDDNPSLTTGLSSDSSVWGYGLEVGAGISYATQLTNFVLTPRFLAKRYEENSVLDSDDWFINVDHSYTGERFGFGLRGAYGDESIRTAERSNVDFDVDDPTDIPDDQSARVFETQKRQRLFIAPEWSFRTGQRSSINLGANYLDVSYDNSSDVFLGDFTDSRALASVEYELSPINSIALSGYYRDNDFDRTSSDYSGYGLTLNFTRSPFENTRFVLAAGVDSTEDQSGNEQTNPIGEISFVRTLQTSRILAAYRRTVSGTGSGDMSVRDSISLALTRDFSERLSLSGGIYAYQTSALDNDTTSLEERDYVQFRGLLAYRVTRAVTIDLDYRYTDIDREFATSAVSSNLVNLWIRYRQSN